MIPGDNDYRFVAVLNKKVDTGKLMNALGHMTAGLAGKTDQADDMHFLQYEDADGNAHPNISHFPYIVLKADNSNKIRTLRKALKEKNIPFTDFTSTMTVGTSEEQLKATKNTPELDLEYFGICFFSKTEDTQELTKKFSLY